MTVEVVVYNIESALRAQEGSADRIELCDNSAEGGTTPSYGTIELVRQNVSRGTIRQLEIAYQAILARFPGLFPADGELKVDAMPVRPARPVPAYQPPRVTILLSGRLRKRQRDLPGLDRSIAQLVDIDDLANWRTRAPSSAYLLVGTQSDWRTLIEDARGLSDLPAIAVILTVSSTPLLRDVGLQDTLSLPSISMFTPSGSRDHSDATKVLEPLIDMLTHAESPKIPGFGPLDLPARHNLLVRADMRTIRDPVELCCQLGARALRSGVRPGARASLYVERHFGSIFEEDYGRLFEPLFAMPYPTQIEVPIDPAIRRTKSRYLTLILERDDLRSSDRADLIREGVERLLAMRGWEAKREGEYLRLSEPTRTFSAFIAFNKEEIPLENEDLDHPAFGRSPLLVIHVSPRREALLVGNRGQFSHIALEDVGKMRPGTTWLWPILRRQLMIPTARPSLAALRLACAIAAEAIRLGRWQLLSEGWSVDRILATLSARDCERFVDFAPDSITRRDALLYMRLPQGADSATDRPDPVLRLAIEDEGPTLIID